MFLLGSVAGLKWVRLNIKRLCSFNSSILILGLIVRVLWISMVCTKPVSDFEYYQKLAAQIAQGGQWGNTYTTVGYPIFLAPFYWLAGPSIWVAELLNLSLSTLNDLLVLNILKKMVISGVWLKLIFSLFVFFPMNIYYNSLVASEILFTTLFLLASLVYLSETRYRYVFIGVITGLNTMIKPFFPLFGLVVLLSDILSQKGFWRSIKNGLFILLMTGVIIAPWLYRNYLLIGELTYVSNNGGIVLYINNNSQNKRGGWMPAEDVENSLIKRPDYLSANLTERNKMLSRAAKAWIRSHPKEFLDLGFKRLQRTFDHFGDKIYGDIFFAFYGSGIPTSRQVRIFEMTEKIRTPIFLGGIFGILLQTGICLYLLVIHPKEHCHRLCQSRGCFLMLLSFYMFVGVYFLTEGQSRYAFPTVFSLVFFAVGGVREIGNIIKWSFDKLRG